MVKEIIHDPFMLSLKSAPATIEDLPVAADLLDTLKANREVCAGMAANMISVQKCIIAFHDGGAFKVMFNPVILKKAEPFETKEGCLSLQGEPRACKRYRKIKVQWQNEKFQTRLQTFEGWSAQIIQHEIDHCNGVLI
ncbi:MAG: peptide deformylase [Ruminococcaceae bacterium]|nr:peptide deformylase [Oscillospiraceae bacterium]